MTVKLVTKLQTIFLLAALLPLAAAGLFTYLQVKASLTEQVLKHLESVAVIQKNRLENLLGQNLERLSLIASRTQLRLSLDAWSRDGAARHLRKIHKILDDAQASIDDIRGIFILDPKGRVIASTNPDWLGRDDSSRDYFLSGSTRSRSDMPTLEPGGGLGLLLSGPLLLEGRSLGVVVVKLKADTLLSMTSDYAGLGATGETLLARRNRDGDIHYLTPLRFDPGAALRRQVEENAHSSLIQALNGHQGISEDTVDYRGHNTLAVARHLPEPDWALVVKIDRDEALAPIAQMRRLTIGGLLLATLVILVASLGMAGSIGRPVELIADVAERIGKGETGVDLGHKLAGAPREIVSLGRSMEQMSQSLSEQQRARERAQERLQRNKWFLDAIVENIPDMIFVKDAADLRFVRFNRAGEQLLGYPRDALIGKNDYDFFPRQEADFFVAKDREVLDSGRLLDIAEEPIETAGQGRRILHTKKIPICDQAGQPLFLLGISEDITDRIRTEKALQESELRFRTAGKAAYDLIYEWDVANASLKWYGDVDGMLGFAQGEVSGEIGAWQELIHPKDVGNLSEAVALRRSATEAIRCEYRIRHHDGEYRHWSDHGLPLLDEQDRPYRWIGVCKDITAHKEHQRQLEYIAHYDTLTALPNRVLLIDRLQQAMAQGKRRERQLAVVYLDLDGFKEINDTHGHDTGDRFLATLAGRLRQVLREGDTIARLGGDEFVAVLIDTGDAVDYLPLLKRLLQTTARPVHLDDKVLQVSGSLGVTFYPQAEEVDADLLLRQSDQAMYQAKLAGKNRYHVFDTEHDRNLRGRQESLERIREALAARELLLHYQPKVNMRSGELIGVEALIRWQHPEQGLLMPIHFLPVVEDQPLAVDLGEWVLDSALTQMEDWQTRGLDIPVSVNIGARQLQHPDFVVRLAALLDAHPGVDAQRLELEVLETSALEDMFQVSRIMHECKRIGVSFALDDFGTGYSSLTYLKHLPAASLKIDRAFVRDMLDDPDDLAILEGILGMSTAFRRQVIAEGVETREHGELLLQLGCDLAQGYGIARPMAAEQFPDWLAGWQPYPSWRNQQRISRDDLSLLSATIEHRAWINALEAYLRGQREEPPPLQPGDCRFGQWLQDDGKDHYGETAAFQAIMSLHDQAHEQGALLYRLSSEGRREQALAGLDELHGFKDRLLTQLGELLAAASRSG